MDVLTFVFVTTPLLNLASFCSLYLNKLKYKKKPKNITTIIRQNMSFLLILKYKFQQGKVGMVFWIQSSTFNHRQWKLVGRTHPKISSEGLQDRKIKTMKGSKNCPYSLNKQAKTEGSNPLAYFFAHLPLKISELKMPQLILIRNKMGMHRNTAFALSVFNLLKLTYLYGPCALQYHKLTLYCVGIYFTSLGKETKQY